MAAVFDPSQPFEVVEGETLDSLIAPRPHVAPPVAPAAPVFDPAKPFTPIADAAPAPTGPVFDPSAPVIKVYGVEEFSAKSVDELLADKDFMPVQFGVQHENDLVDPALRSKLEEVYAARERAGTSLKDKVKSTFTGIFPAVKTLTEGVKSAAKLAAKFTPAGIAKRVIEGTPQEFINDYAKSGTEAAASVELAALGSTDLIRRSTRAVGEAVGMLPGDLPAVAAASGVPVRRSKADMTEGDWRNRLSDDIAAAKQVETAGAGNGEVMQAFGIDAATLEQDFGIKVDPEEIARLSVVTDPINYVPLGATVGAVTKLGGKAVRLGVAATRTTEQAAKLANILNTATAAAGAVKSGASTVAGAVAQGVGGVVEKIGAVADKGVRSLGGTGAGVGLGGILGGSVYSALGGAAIAKAAPRLIQKVGKTITATGKILTGEAAAPAALTLAGDTLKAGAAGAVKGALEGGALILPFEIGARPEEEEQLLGMVGLGAGIRAGAEGARPVARAAGRAAQNKLAETIFQTVEQQPLAESPTYGTDSLLDSNHAANVAKISPREQKLVAWGRELLRGAGGEVYVLDTPTFAREAQGNKTARGYAVSIGVAQDGSAKPLFRIFLNRDAEALPHEFFHALTDLDPKRAADFRDVVQKSLTPDQLRSFEQLYNSLRNDGLPEVQWKTRLTPEQVANEAAAETFSRIFLAQDLSGVAPSVQNKAALFVSSLLEKLGAPLAKVGANPKEAGVSSLGVRPGTESVKVGQAWVKNMLERVNDEGTLGQPPIIAERPKAQTPIPTKLVSQKPAGAKPVPAAPVPVPAPRPAPVNPPLPAAPRPKTGPRNIRAARQDDFAGRRAEVTNIDAARAAAEATGDANMIARVNELAAIIEAGSPVVEIEHSGVRAAGTVEAPSGRTARRLEQENAYIAEGMANAPESIREAYKKVLVIYKLDVVGGKVQALGMSLDKVIANTHKTVKEAAARGVADRIPYEITDGKLTDNAWGQVVDDLKAYADNQSNGYRGDGQKLIRPTEDVGLSIPAENPAYSPRVISEERANFLNMVQGLNPPLTARVGKQSSAVLPGNVKGQILAEVNARKPETPSVIRPEDITKQEFKPGISVKEMNPLRNELAAAGVPVRELIEVTERINAADINSVTPRPELDFKAPVTDTIRGGFLPGDTAKQITDVQAMSGDEFTAATRAWDGGLTKRAWDTGLSTKTPEDVLALKMAQEDATAKGKALRAEKKTSEAMPWIYKSQFFREAYEAATDTLSAAGPNGWRSAFPDREAPFPETAPKGDLLPADPNETVRSLAETYRAARDLDVRGPDHKGYDEVNVPLAKKLAEFYDSAKDSPEDPAVQASYQALADETLAQYQAMKDAGYTIEAFTGEGEPYKSSAEMVADVRDNKHLFFLKTEGNFTGAEANPMLRPGPDGLLVNDVFRAVHDFFGHAKEGYQFGPRGEFNAWKAHSTMFTDAAQGSLAAETLAQNSWVNYGKHLKEGTPLKDRPFAEQKNVVVPAELIAEARGDFLPGGDSPIAPEDLQRYKNTLISRVGNKSTLQIPEGIAKSFLKSLTREDLTPIPNAVSTEVDVRLISPRGKTVKSFAKRLDLDNAVRDIQQALGVNSEVAKSSVEFFSAEPPAPITSAEAAAVMKDTTIAGRDLMGSGWLFRDGKAVEVDSGFYHDDAVDGINAAGKVDARSPEQFQAETGAVRIGTTSSARAIGDFGNADLGISMSRKLSGAQRNEIARLLKGQVDEETPHFGKVSVDITKEDGTIYAGRSFEYPAERGALARFLTDPFADEFAVKGDFLPTGREWEATMAARRAAGKAPKVAAKPAGKLTPAMWILPDGEVKKVTATYHELDLMDNAADYNKRFGTDFSNSVDPSQDPRMEALNRGFVRVRYSPENGRTAVEVGAGHWSKQKAKVLDTLLNSADKVDRLVISVLDENGSAVDTVSATVFNADDKAAAITDAVNDVVAPTVKRAKGVAPSDIVRMRALPGPGDFLPAELKTESGREALKKFSVSETTDEFTGQKGLEVLDKAGKRVGFVDYSLPDVDGSARLENIFVEYDRRDAGIGSALFREAAQRMKDAGATSITGSIEGNTVNLRKKIFGRGATEFIDSDGFTVSPAEAKRHIAGGQTVHAVSYFSDNKQFLPGDVTPLLDLGLPSEERMKQVRVKARVNKARDAFPEALAPEYQKDNAGKFILGEDGKPKPIVQEYQFMESPLAREAAKGLKGVAREEAFTDALAKKLVTAAKAGAKRADIQAGAKWYSTTRTRLKALLGDDTKFFCELLGATSARTPVDTNYRFSMDVYNRFKAGDYDGIIGKYREGKAKWDSGQIQDYLEASGNENPSRGQFLDWWVESNDISPVQSNGKKFGMNSRSVLRVLDGSWRDEVQGPKTPNFAGNLSGETFEATIDVWAARLLHRLANEGNAKRWRILAENETGVTDADFYIGQAAYRKAADKLGMKPDSLQAILWFLEKDYWEKKGWTRGAGAAKSDFQSLLADTERTDAGQLRRKTPQNELALPMEPGDIQTRK